MIEKAREFAKKSHAGQTRKDGIEPYFNHCARVYSLLKKFTDNEDILAAALLHDTIEDCDVTAKQLECEFNPVVSAIVVELTNVFTKKAYPDLKRKERKSKELERLSKISWSSRLVKLADRSDNLYCFKKETDDYNEDFYYIKESRELLKVLSGTHSALEGLVGDLVYKFE